MDVDVRGSGAETDRDPCRCLSWVGGPRLIGRSACQELFPRFLPAEDAQSYSTPGPLLG